MIELVDKCTFDAAYRKYMEDGGHSYDQWDLQTAWSVYCKRPSEYDFLFE